MRYRRDQCGNLFVDRGLGWVAVAGIGALVSEMSFVPTVLAVKPTAPTPPSIVHASDDAWCGAGYTKKTTKIHAPATRANPDGQTCDQDQCCTTVYVGKSQVPMESCHDSGNAYNCKPYIFGGFFHGITDF